MKVVFHADDFGLSQAVNDGILEAHERGLLGSTSVIVAAAAAEEAARATRAHPTLDVGIHLTLVEERPVLPAERLPTITAGGRFWPKHTAVVARYLTARWRPAEARAELAAQWQRASELGFALSHADGHQHLHLLPGVLPAVVADARRHGVHFVRTRLADPLRRDAGVVRQGLLLATEALARVAWAGVPAADREACVPFVTVGFLDAGGTLTTDGLLAALDRLRGRAPHAIVEVMLHPGRRDADTVQRYGHWGYQWERDLALLLDPVLSEALARRDVQVTSFRALAEEWSRRG
jgi:predicted glycoside hydrolase/deacetylase ChbG (UPF0249 family)